MNPARSASGSTLFFVAAAVFVMGGCGAGAQSAEDELALGAQTEFRPELSLEVQNLNFYDAELYAYEAGHRERIGFVAGNATEMFAFRWPPGRDLRIEIHLVSVGTYVTDRLPVQAGDELQLIIEPDLHRDRPVRLRPRG
jgi:hypothetical protein